MLRAYKRQTASSESDQLADSQEIRNHDEVCTADEILCVLLVILFVIVEFLFSDQPFILLAFGPICNPFPCF